MPDIQPCRGLRYRVPDADLSKVLAPPYDVITPAYQAELYARDPRNIVRVVLNRTAGDGAYDEAGATFRGWVAAGLLVPDADPALYLVEQSFEVEGQAHKRHGLLARFRVEDNARGRVLPHEHTRKAAKEDRYKLLKATRANFSPIFMMFSDRQGVRETGPARRPGSARLPVTDDGGAAPCLSIRDGANVSALQSAIGSEKAYIADGHHSLGHRPAVSPGSRRGGGLDLGLLHADGGAGAGRAAVPPPPGPRSRGRGGARLAPRSSTLTDVKGGVRGGEKAAESKAAYAFGLPIRAARASSRKHAAGPRISACGRAAQPARPRHLLLTSRAPSL